MRPQPAPWPSTPLPTGALDEGEPSAAMDLSDVKAKPNGSRRAPMIAAEAFASIDMATILAFIFLRSRSTFERLPSASERLPPALVWMAITMPKKFASGRGMFS